jgi:alpha-galactosidase
VEVLLIKHRVDFLKYDNCNDDGTSTKSRYIRMRDALNASGRPIFFSMCSWGNESPWEWAKNVGNSWRTTLDMSGRYNTMVEILDQNIGLSKYAGPGGWNDPDLL